MGTTKIRMTAHATCTQATASHAVAQQKHVDCHPYEYEDIFSEGEYEEDDYDDCGDHWEAALSGPSARFGNGSGGSGSISSGSGGRVISLWYTHCVFRRYRDPTLPGP